VPSQSTVCRTKWSQAHQATETGRALTGMVTGVGFELFGFGRQNNLEMPWVQIRWGCAPLRIYQHCPSAQAPRRKSPDKGDMFCEFFDPMSAVHIPEGLRWCEQSLSWFGLIGLSGCRLPVSISIIVPQVRFSYSFLPIQYQQNGDHCGAYLVSRNCDLSCFFSVLVIDSKFNFLLQIQHQRWLNLQSCRMGGVPSCS
jgi:hypothetical protein